MQPRHLSFHSFNALRFFAFFKVFLLHVSSFNGGGFLHNFVFDGGEIGVDFFFVLSGFLITYLLAFEKLRNGTINGKKYFLRRSLRIWPLFYLGILIAYTNIYISGRFSLGSNEGYSPNVFVSLSFLENYSMIFQNNFPNGAPLRVFWSLCVEEHFYFIWFFLFRMFSLKQLVKVFIILWMTGIAYRIGFYLLFPQKNYYDFDVVSKFDFFCAGGLAGLQVARGIEQVKKSIHKINVFTRNGFAIFVLAFFFFHQLIPGGRIADLYFPIISASLFSGLIVLVATSSSFLHIKETHIFSQLGKMSYGLYVYHSVVLVVLLAVVNLAGFQFRNPILFFSLCSISFLLTAGISFLSFKYFETPFLRLKENL